MRYVTEPTETPDGKRFEVAAYQPDAEERDHVAVTVQTAMAADIIVGMLDASVAAGRAARNLDADVIANAMAYLLAPWGSAASERGLRTEVAEAWRAGHRARAADAA